MKDDLLPALASVDWAISKLPTFEDTLDAWLRDNIEIAVTENPAPATHNCIIARQKAELPLEFSVEAGAYINAVRSSLDILAVAIARRDTEAIPYPSDIYFPVADSLDDFTAGNYKGVKFVKSLSKDSFSVIENFKPYQGGNDNIWACHKLDITRKHKRLLETYIRPAKSRVTGWGLSEIFKPVATGFMPAGNGETVLGLLLKGAKCPEVHYTARVCLNERSAALPGYSVIAAIEGFSNVARAVITAFDR